MNTRLLLAHTLNVPQPAPKEPPMTSHLNPVAAFAVYLIGLAFAVAVAFLIAALAGDVSALDVKVIAAAGVVGLLLSPIVVRQHTRH